MTPPDRSQEQRASALASAMRVRLERADLRQALKAGTARPGATLDDDRYRGVRVRWFLESLPGIGAARAESMMTELRIAPSRRLGGLSDRQRQALALRLEARP